MKLSHVAVAVALMVGFSVAQSAPAPAPNNMPAQTSTAQPQTKMGGFAPGTELRAQLDKTVDAKKAKAGDPVVAKSMDEIKSGTEVVAPRGAKIIGHVVSASPHEKGSPSQLEIAFDKFDLANGSEVPLKAAIRAVQKPPNNELPPSADSGGGTNGGNPGAASSGTPGGMGQRNTAPNSGEQASTASNMPSSGPATQSISRNAQGVTGFSGITLNPGPSQDTMFTSEKHNVKLDGGTQMVLRVE